MFLSQTAIILSKMILTSPVSIPKSDPPRAIWATRALVISVLAGVKPFLNNTSGLRSKSWIRRGYQINGKKIPSAVVRININKIIYLTIGIKVR